MGGFLSHAERAGRWLENLLLATILFSMIGLATSQVLMRVIAGAAFAWGDEALRLLVLWAAMAGALAASRDDSHLRIDLAARFLPPAGQALASLIVDAFTALVAAVLAWYSVEFVAESREFGDLLLGSLPAWPFQLVMPVAFGLIAWRYLVWSGRRLLHLARGGAAP
jgi:TRAP-type C4-dicarboxylate transport system permease small subunit